MNFSLTFIAALILLSAIGLVIWVLICMAQAEADLRAFSGTEKLNV